MSAQPVVRPPAALPDGDEGRTTHLAPAAATQVIARHRAPRDYAVRRLLAAADSIAIAGAMFAVAAMHLGIGELSFKRAELALLTLPVWLAIFRSYSLYDRDAQRISHTTIDELPALFHAMLLGTVLEWGYLRFVTSGRLPFAQMIAFGLLATAIVMVLRSLARAGVPQILGPERALLIGDGPEVAILARKLRGHPEYCVRLVGIVTRSPALASECRLPMVGMLQDLDLERVVGERAVERIIVARFDTSEAIAPRDAEDPWLDLMRRCKNLRLRVSVLPHLHDAMGSSVVLDDVEGLTILAVNPPVLSRSSRALKRSVDIAGSLVLGLAFVVLGAVIAVAIKLDSPGPVFFRQRRVGRWGQVFTIFKFRTMVVGAEGQQAALAARSRDPGWLLLEHDDRITRVGRVLRTTSLDELPQLWNVLKGEMSLVGPRPLIEAEDSQLRGWRRSRLDLKPGLTGLWQILGRTDIPFDEMVKLDYLYVTNWSLWSDIRLIARTLPAVLRKQGVN